MLRFKRLFMLTFSIATLVACAASQEQAQGLDEKPTVTEILLAKGYVAGAQVRRIQNYRLNGWSYVDSQHVIMTSGVSDRYLVTLKSPCYDLRGAITIGFSTTIGNLSDHDRLIVRAPGDFTDTCLIDTLHELHRMKKTAGAE